MEAEEARMKPDDCSLTSHQLKRVRAEAERALREAGAMGVFPTPVANIMAVAKVEEAEDEALDDGLIARMRKVAGTALKSAFSKVLGLFHASAGLVYIDRTMHAVKQTFVRLHEAAHGFLPWQRGLYAVVEDCENSLDPDVASAFDREANVFASEVLFQMDSFIERANDKEFGIFTPIGLAKTYGASLYASIRQYVSKNHRCCVVLVLNPPEIREGVGFTASLRRVVASQDFQRRFANTAWPNFFTPNDKVGALVPINRRASGKRAFELTDANGMRHECVAEAFTQTHQVFVLIHVKQALNSTIILLPG
ncbi:MULTISPECIES: ImmA/IrrE family metallo-endopeptidase [Xanthomonas]|nr:MULTISPECIES: ImmA/IrrE family metallo-endopeptidase [Xanthomonas]MEA9973368.1 ImmA/IrrE family metallo-endopeptidase [Xanthomonas campestris pv. raphani]UKE61749.1 ImmA/IrrE family metallo-endopeptidase [Xanthomonas translucens pv. poae]